MKREISHTLLLRLAAFLFDALSVLVILITPATIASYAAVLVWNSVWSVARIWSSALLLLALAMLLRDGWRGRSPGKRLFGLRVRTPDGRPCSWFRSVVRNLPLVIPGWNLVEVALVLLRTDSVRTGDRLAKTRIVIE